MGRTPTPKPPPVLVQSGSAIDAAGGKLEQDQAVMAGAVNALGGGSRRRRRKIKQHRGGAEVKVGSAPNFVSAGGVDTKQMFAGLLQAQHQAGADATYDKLGSAPPMQINPQTQEGGRRSRRSRRNRRSIKKSPEESIMVAARVNLFANIIGLAVCLVVFAVLWFSYNAVQKRMSVPVETLLVPGLFVLAVAVGLLYVYLYLDTWVIAVKQSRQSRRSQDTPGDVLAGSP